MNKQIEPVFPIRSFEDGHVLSIVLAGVGGQGTLIAGKLLGILALKLGLDVKVSEVHGMSQRGGSVITYVRIGKKVFSPIVEEKTADFCLCFESLEALRWAGLLKNSGRMIINTQQFYPLPVLMGQLDYPDAFSESLCSACANPSTVLSMDALSMAREVGSTKATNIVLLGALSVFSDFPESLWHDSIREAFAKKPATIPMNIEAFEKGRDFARTFMYN